MILPTRSMQTYTGAGRTSTYLREHHLQKAAKNNQKITSFFQPQAKPSNQFTSHCQITDIPWSPALTQSLSPSSNVIGLTGMMLTSESNTSSPSYNSEDESGTRMDVTQLALNLTSAELNHSGSGLADGDNTDADILLTSFLDMTGDDKVTETNSKPVLKTISRLMEEAKKVIYLHVLSRFTPAVHCPVDKVPRKSKDQGPNAEGKPCDCSLHRQGSIYGSENSSSVSIHQSIPYITPRQQG